MVRRYNNKCSPNIVKIEFFYSGLGSNLSLDIIKADFVQILYNGANHRVTVSNLDPQPSHIHIYYDSMFRSIFDHRSIADQICAIMHSNQPIMHSNQPMITVHHTMWINR